MKQGWSTYELKVRYAETDQMGVVYHAHYLPWLELGRTEFLRESGISYKELEAKGLLVPVLSLNIVYHNPAYYDDSIVISTRLSEFGQIKLSFEYEIRRKGKDDGVGDRNSGKGKLLASAVTHHAWLNREWKPVRIRREAPDVYDLLTKS